MKNYFNKIWQYNGWANHRCLQKISSQLPEYQELNIKFSHIISAEEIWYNRIEPLPYQPLPLFAGQPWERLSNRMEQSQHRWLELINATVEWSKVIHYENTSGTPYQTRLEDIVIHVVNHGTYHRGQIALLLRQQDQDPLATDYIVFNREY